MEKLEWCGYLIAKKYEDVFIRFDRIQECDRQAHGRTDRHTDRRHRPRLCIASRGKNGYICRHETITAGAQRLWDNAITFARWQHPATGNGARFAAGINRLPTAQPTRQQRTTPSCSPLTLVLDTK